MNSDWDMFVDLEKNNLNTLENKCPIHDNKVDTIKKPKTMRRINYLYTIDETKVVEETDFFKRTPIKELNMYKDKFLCYKLKTSDKK